VRIESDLKDWFLKYLQDHSIGESDSDRFRAFLYALKNQKIPTITAEQDIFKCQKLKRALHYFCNKCRTETPSEYQACPNMQLNKLLRQDILAHRRGY